MTVDLSKRPLVPANLADLSGDEWQDLADDVNAYEAAHLTPLAKTFLKLVGQHHKGLLTDTDLWAETVQIVLGAETLDDLLPPEPVEVKTLVGHGPTSTYRVTDAEGNFLGFSAKP